MRYIIQQNGQMYAADATVAHLVIWHAIDGTLYGLTRYDATIWEATIEPMICAFASYLRAQLPPPRTFTRDFYELRVRFMEHFSKKAHADLWWPSK